jgi:hypothetical protein
LGIQLPQLVPMSGDCTNRSLERIVTATCNLDEMVDLLALSRSYEGSAGPGMTRKIATLPLREAVTRVVEDWADDKFRQLSAVIVRHSGPPIRSLDDIRDLYAQAEAAPAS